MSDNFKIDIFIDRLIDGKTQKIEDEVPSVFFDINENVLSINEATKVNGQAYLADDYLIIKFSAIAKVILPCSICNDETSVDIKIDKGYHTVAIKDISSKIFDFAPFVRETILLEVPSFIECNNGNCSKRAEISKFFNKRNKVTHPFESL